MSYKTLGCNKKIYLLRMNGKTLILSATSSQFYYYIGGVMGLVFPGNYNGINRFIGVSSGAFLAALLASNIDPVNILQTMINLKLNFTLKDIKTWILTPSADSGLFSNIRMLVRNFLVGKFTIVPTLRQLYNATGNRLDIITTNLKNKESIVLNYQTAPDLSVEEAVMYSWAYPTIFERMTYLGDVVINGMFSNPIPIDLCGNDDHIILFTVESPVLPEEPTTFDILYHASTIPVDILFQQKLKTLGQYPNLKWYNFKSAYRDFLGISLSNREYTDMISSGTNLNQHLTNPS